MKIAIADNNGGKFTTDIKEHWMELGHEVKFERGASEHLAQWADIYYVDTWDNNIHYLYKLYHGLHDDMPKDWDNKKKPRIVVRVLDWEVWIGLVRDQSIIDWVNDIIFIVPHIQEKVESEVELNDKGHLIRPGVNLEKFTLKSSVTDGFQIGMALGDMWWPKNHMAGLDIFTSLYQKDNRYRLHIRGQHEGGEYWKQMFEHYLDSRGIKEAVTLYSHVESMNDWYENVDILLHPGMKEAFCYAVGEAMAKGIPVVVNNFYGAGDIWPKKVLYQLHEEAVRTIERLAEFKGERKRQGEWAREYIEKEYDVKRMVKEMDELLGL